MSIYGDPIIMGKAAGGGGGGGGGNAYAYGTPPSASVGKNGDYYFELFENRVYTGLISEPYSQANTPTGGWEFVPTQDIVVIGAKGLVTSSYTGIIKLAAGNGTILAEKSVEFSSNLWANVTFDTPVTLTSGNPYIIMLFGSSGTLLYQKKPTTTYMITYIRGRYGSLPGSAEAYTAYSVDIIIQGDVNPPYPVKKQYYKTNEVWVPL